MDARLIEPGFERSVAVDEDHDQPPWIKLLSDPLPPTPEMLGGALREQAPSLHEEVASLATQHPVIQRDTLLWSMVWQLFHTIVEWLPEDVRAVLVPASEAIEPATEKKAVTLLTRSERWQPRRNPRSSFVWPHEEVYEFSEALTPRSRPNAPEDVREATAAAYRLFVRVAVALSRLFEHCWIDPRTLRALRQRTV